MNFKVLALDQTLFKPFYGMADEELQKHGVIPHIAETKPGFPCRVSLLDAEPGEKVLLLNFEHLAVNNPYQSRHAILVRDGAESAVIEPGEVPRMLSGRQLSVRAFDAEDLMTDAVVIPGHACDGTFQQMLDQSNNLYLHVHNAARGCYLARVERS